MRNLLKGISLVAILLSATATFAQQAMPQKTPQERAQNQTQWMQKNLSITDDQGKKIYDIILKYAQQTDAARAEGPGKDRRAEMQAINSGRENELKAVLTGDQYQKYQAHQQEMREKMRERREGAQGNGGF